MSDRTLNRLAVLATVALVCYVAGAAIGLIYLS